MTGSKIEPSANSLTFYDIKTHPDYAEPVFFTIIIKNIIAYSKSLNTEEIFILVSGKKGVFNQAIELAGFEEYY